MKYILAAKKEELITYDGGGMRYRLTLTTQMPNKDTIDIIETTITVDKDTYDKRVVGETLVLSLAQVHPPQEGE